MSGSIRAFPVVFPASRPSGSRKACQLHETTGRNAPRPNLIRTIDAGRTGAAAPSRTEFQSARLCRSPGHRNGPHEARFLEPAPGRKRECVAAARGGSIPPPLCRSIRQARVPTGDRPPVPVVQPPEDGLESRCVAAARSFRSARQIGVAWETGRRGQPVVAAIELAQEI